MIRIVAFLGALVIFASGCATTKHSDASLKGELEAMYDTDQSHRSEMQAVGTIDEANIARLGQIIEEHGWPGRSLVGDKGAIAAFLVLQHTDYTYQKKYLPLVRASVAASETRAEDLALLEDRILMREGKKQIYGSQLQQNDKGAWEFYPIEDEPNVDKRRQAVGLPLLAEYAKQFGFECHPK